ncbi:MAG: hypothetical protein KGL38_09155 [Gemmatimonadota bacterium]|nr:hypothetical protein [Gemmatimonadota bacterium]MDE3215715.1 hypothetical protein [Gemmatimonadota bacterium]
MTFARFPLARAAVGACLAALAAGRVAAQGADPAATHAGTLSVRGEQQIGLALAPPAQRRAGYAAAQAIVALLRSDAALARPLGYSVSLAPVAGTTQLVPGGRPATGRIVYGVKGSLDYFRTAEDGRSVRADGGLVDFSVVVNAPGRYTDAEQVAAQPDHGPPVLSDIRKTGEFRGHPIYNGECIVVSGRGEAPFVPLAMGRYYQLLILDYRADSVRHAAEHRQGGGAPAGAGAGPSSAAARAKRDADMQATYEQLKKIDPKAAEQYLAQARAMEAQLAAQAGAAGGAADSSPIAQAVRLGAEKEGQNLARLQSALDALSPAQRGAAVAVRMHGVDWSYRNDELADVGDPESSPLVQLNPAFFDPSKPATAAQLVTVCLPGVQGLEDKSYERLAGEEREQERRTLQRRTRDAVAIRDHLDWAALEALVSK